MRFVAAPLLLAAGTAVAGGSAIARAGAAPAPIFVDASDRLGLVFTHDAGVEGRYFMPESLGSGGALLDYDNDGDLDVYLVNGAYRDPRRRAAQPLKNRLFRQGVDGRFTDVTAGSGLGDEGYGMGVAVGDYDNDGDVDVYVCNTGPDTLYRNNGDGTFVDVSRAAGVDNPHWASSALFFDYDNDGDLDINVVNYVAWKASVVCTDPAGRADYCGPQRYPGVADVLYRNDGNGRFTDVSATAGLARAPSKGLGHVAADFDGNGLADLFVANDRVANQLWLNQGDGSFRENALLLGAALDALGHAGASMGIALGDADGDAALDLYVTQLFNENNNLLRGLGARGFAEETAAAGLTGSDLPLTGFGTGFFDYDNDGDLDLAVVNGRVIRGPLLTAARPADYWDEYAEPNLLFANDGQGTFRDVSARAGDFASLVENSRGLAFGDVDNDGDLDLLVTNEGGRARLLLNQGAAGRHWLLVHVVDPRLRRHAIGARVSVQVAGRELHRFVSAAYSYQSSSDLRVHFGLGAAMAVDRIRVRWPDGRLETFPGRPADQIITLEKGKGR